jgi:hypothetical protein
MFFEIRSRPRGGGVWGGIRAGFGFSFFGGAGIKKEKYITLKSRQSRDATFSIVLDPPTRSRTNPRRF